MTRQCLGYHHSLNFLRLLSTSNFHKSNNNSWSSRGYGIYIPRSIHRDASKLESQKLWRCFRHLVLPAVSTRPCLRFAPKISRDHASCKLHSGWRWQELVAKTCVKPTTINNTPPHKRASSIITTDAVEKIRIPPYHQGKFRIRIGGRVCFWKDSTSYSYM